jgi:hypothetical protein
MSETLMGSGEAFVVNSKCYKVVPFTSSYKWTWSGSSEFYKINYNNSFIGSRILSAIYSLDTNLEVSSDGLLNFTTEYFFDPDTEIYYIYLIITGVYKKCNYASEELDVFTPTASSSAVIVNTLKKKSKSPDEFHKLLDLKPNLKKKYLQIKAKLGK